MTTGDLRDESRSAGTIAVLHQLVGQFGPRILDDADELEAMLSDAHPEPPAAEVNLVIDAVRHGVLTRMRSLRDHGAQVDMAVDVCAQELLDKRGGTDPRGARWVSAALGSVAGLLPDEIARRYAFEYAAERQTIRTGPPMVPHRATEPLSRSSARGAGDNGTRDGFASTGVPGQGGRRHPSRTLAIIAIVAVLVVLVGGLVTYLAIASGDSLPAVDGEAGEIFDVVEEEGYECYQSLSDPILVRQCFLDGSSAYVGVQYSADGRVDEVRLTMGGSEGDVVAERWDAVSAQVVQILLPTEDAEAVVDALDESENFDLDWGSVDVFAAGDTSKGLAMVRANNFDVTVDPEPLDISAADLQAALEAEGFDCEASFQLTCQRDAEQGVFQVEAQSVDDTDQQVAELTASIGPASGEPPPSEEEVLEFFVAVLDTLADAETPDAEEIREWLEDSFEGENLAGDIEQHEVRATFGNGSWDLLIRGVDW